VAKTADGSTTAKAYTIAVVRPSQGDQMSLGKNVQYVDQPMFVKINTQLSPRKKWPKIFGLLLQFPAKKLPKENSRPKGENSPNLVTLVGECAMAVARTSLSCLRAAPSTVWRKKNCQPWKKTGANFTEPFRPQFTGKP
jgi:hypothetical protein